MKLEDCPVCTISVNEKKDHSGCIAVILGKILRHITYVPRGPG